MTRSPDAPVQSLIPPDHPDRLALAEEVHARPPDALATPSRATFVAIVVAPDERAAEFEHLAALCARYSLPPPAPEARHFSAPLGAVRFKWERHGEFSGYTFFTAGRSPTPFSEPPIRSLPPDWLAAVPGRTLFAAHAKLVADAREPDADFLAAHFGNGMVVGAEIGGGAALAFTDFRIHADGFGRVLLLDRSLTPRQAGRMMQRLFEIEAYRMLALLALPVARHLGPRIARIETALAGLTDDIARQSVDDEKLLPQLTRLADEVEQSLAGSQFRFGACRAYAELVARRIAELRERRLPGMQTIEEFMARRFTPAVATCESTAQRLRELSERVAQASALLSTRVNIARERQNQQLLASMDRRAQLQLRLQQTVEVLSVAAIVYYVAGLVGYLAKALHAMGVPVQPEIAMGVAVPVAALVVLWVLRRVRRRLLGVDAADRTRPAS